MPDDHSVQRLGSDRDEARAADAFRAGIPTRSAPFVYKAFISYSHSADASLSSALQSRLQQFAKPWYRVRNFRVFRDATNLSVSPALWPRIEEALAASEYLLFMASPLAAQSHWVRKELAYWREHKDASKILIVLSDGVIGWDERAQDYDWAATTALPDVLRNAFSQEPLYIDFTGFRESRLSLNDPHFLDCIATVAATLHGKSKDEIAGEHIRQHRRTMQWAWSAIFLLSALLVTAVSMGILWRGQRNNALRQYQLATIQRLATQSFSGDDSLDRKLLLAAEAVQRGEGEVLPAAEQAFRQAVANFGPIALLSFHKYGRYRSGRQGDLEFTGDSMHGVTGTHLSANGRWLLYAMKLKGTREVWRFDLAARDPARTLLVFDSGYVDDSGSYSIANQLYNLAISDDGRYLAADTGYISPVYPGVLLWTAGTETGQPALKRLPWSDRPANAPTFFFSPDGRWLVHDRDVWDVDKPEPAATRRTLGASPAGFTNDGRLVAVEKGKKDIRVRLWRLDDPNEEEVHGPLDEGAAHALVYPGLLKPDRNRMSPDGRWALEREGYWVTRAWQPQAGGRVGPQKEFTSSDDRRSEKKMTLDGAFSGDGHWLATIGPELRLWDLTLADPFARPAFTIETPGRLVAFSPRGRWLVSVGDQVRLWDLSNDEPGVSSIALPLPRPSAATFGADGRWLITEPESAAGMASVWDLDLSRMMERAGPIAGRNFTDGEWRYFFPGETYRPTFPEQPRDPAPLNAARTLAREGQLDEAITALRRAGHPELEPEARALAAAFHIERGEQLIFRASGQALVRAKYSEYDKSGAALLLLRPGEHFPLQTDYDASLAAFRLARELNPDLPLDPVRRAGQLATQGWLHLANVLARRGDLDGALALFRLIGERYPALPLDPLEREARRAALSSLDDLVYREASDGRLDAALAWADRLRGHDAARGAQALKAARAFAARREVEAAAKAAASGSRPEAEAKLKVALGLIGDTDEGATFNGRRAAAEVLSQAGLLAVRWNRFEDAVKWYRRADIIRIQVNISSERISAREWNYLCWQGCLYGHAALVEFAGERAVADPYDGKNPDFHDTLALARGILGKFDASIAGFAYYLEHTKDDEQHKAGRARRREWIEALRRGVMPFTPEVLDSLKRPG